MFEIVDRLVDLPVVFKKNVGAVRIDDIIEAKMGQYVRQTFGNDVDKPWVGDP